MESNRGEYKQIQDIVFHREGQKPDVKDTRVKASILGKAKDWKLQVDIKKKLVFPQDVVATNLRPDLLLHSDSTRSLLIVELTVPWEERLQVAHERKRLKYQDLVDNARRNGWNTTLFAIEVGTRGFPSASLQKFLSALGLQPRTSKRALKSVAAVAESSSRWLWIRRGEPWSASTGGEQHPSTAPLR